MAGLEEAGKQPVGGARDQDGSSKLTQQPGRPRGQGGSSPVGSDFSLPGISTHPPAVVPETPPSEHPYLAILLPVLFTKQTYPLLAEIKEPRLSGGG